MSQLPLKEDWLRHLNDPAKLEGYRHGILLTLELLEELTGIPRYAAHWQTIVAQLQKIFASEDTTKPLALPIQGYSATPQQHDIATQTQSRQWRLVRSYGEVINALQVLPGGLTIHQQELRRAIITELLQARQAAQHYVREYNTLAQPRLGLYSAAARTPEE